VRSRPSTPKTPTPQKSTASNSGPSPSTLPPPSKRQKILDSPTTLSRDANAKKRAEERDNYCCVLTGIELIEVVHIYPHHAMKQKEEDRNGPRHTFWRNLELFWPEEKVATWKANVFPDGISEKGQEEVYNLISLAPNVHAMWGRGLFALKPISESDDKKTLMVQFFWQTKQKDSLPTIPLTTQPHSTKNLEQFTGAHGGSIWLHDKNKKPIQSGDSFELNTDDPIKKPLPSFELLELQWFLQRVQGMAGAADVDWEEPWLDTDSDSDYGVEEAPSLAFNDDVEDFSLLSEDSLSSLAKPDYPLYPKHVVAGVKGEGDGDREGGSDLVIRSGRGG
jgi:hypothetical protein